MSRWADFADRALEVPVVTSFTSIGSSLRRHLDDWTDLDSYELDGRVIVITGATSGLGLAAARQLGRCGATVVLAGRNPDKTTRVRAELAAETGSDRFATVTIDTGDLDAVRAAAATVLADHDRLDVLVHNAGALSDERRETAAGTEVTIASQVVGPFLLTSLLLERLEASRPARVLTMASGGMYAAPLTVSDLEMSADDYRGSEQYARAKRAQVTLNEMWAARLAGSGVHFHALHPGWADTPGVEASLPTFRRVVGPLLRAPEDGADTLVWLAADDGEPLAGSGDFWLDRRRRSIHKLPTTRRSDTPERRARLWERCCELAGVDPATFV
jgi:NAD(P)-dependent dehydrogenase (short-subunit alcohol dehydrogenase family)